MPADEHETYVQAVYHPHASIAVASCDDCDWQSGEIADEDARDAAARHTRENSATVTLHVDLTGANVGDGWFSVEVRLARYATNDVIEAHAARHYDVPSEQVHVV